MLTKLKSWFLARNRGGGPIPGPPADLETLIHNSQDMIMRLNKDIKLSYISPACLHIFGRTPEEMLGGKLKDYALPEDKPVLTAAGGPLFAGNVETNTVAFRIRRADGAIRWIEVNARAERDLIGERTGHYVIVARDVTRHRELEDQLQVLARIDPLTGLANRRAFDEGLARAWRGAMRSQWPLSLLLLDFDNFKQYNDTYGHQAGDDCLRNGASAVAAAVKRPLDLVARYGGEEIAAILPETEATGAIDVAMRILDFVRDLRIPHQQNPPGDGFVSLSIGIASVSSQGLTRIDTPTALVESADQALYAAKALGRNRLAVAPVMLSALSEPAAKDSEAGD